MGGAAGVDGDDIMRKLYDIDEDNHKMRIIRQFKNEAEAEAYKRKYRADRATRLFASGARKVVFRKIKVNGRMRTVAMQKRMGWRPKGGNMHHRRSVKPFFDNKPIDGES